MCVCVCVLKKRRKRERGSQTQREREREGERERVKQREKGRAGEREKDSDRDLGEAKLPTAFNLTKQKNREKINNNKKRFHSVNVLSLSLIFITKLLSSSSQTANHTTIVTMMTVMCAASYPHSAACSGHKIPKNHMETLLELGRKRKRGRWGGGGG